MTHCGQPWVDMIEKHPELCEHSEDYRRKIEYWIGIVDQIAKRGFDKKTVLKKFPEGAARELKSIKDDATREKALNYICHCLKRGEKVTGPDLKKSIGVKEGTCTSCTEENHNTNVLSPSPNNDVKPCCPIPAAPIAQTLKERYAPVNPSNSTGLEDPPKPRPAPCISGQPCPDGKEHKMILPNGKIPKCTLFNQYINQLIRDECYLDLKARKQEKESAFLKASEFDPLTGGKLIKGEPYKIIPVQLSKDQAEDLLIQFVRGYLTNKDREALGEILRHGELGNNYPDIFTGLIWYASENMEGK